MPNSNAACAALITFALALLSACATSIDTTPVSFRPAPGASAPELTLDRAVEIRLPTGYTRTLASGSRWRHVGDVAQGRVFRPIDAVFSIEGRQVHEAYLVIADRSLVGFYLPGESAYSPLGAPIPLSSGGSR
ncbi:hypothetical protein HLB44_02770 [Aquincola sp. S2]|uniref:Lipoprotein n=2 Tax=Pseudaquabacterium terrae TaxID=2732868 RepID=A0ABX2EA22_9BURK|nr:hypothetical protein [Aquabacterium terrae]